MKKLTYILAIAVLGAYGCKDTEPEPQPVPEVQILTISIDHKINGSDIDWINSPYTLPSGNEVKMTRLSYLMSNFYLLKADGDTLWLEDQYALIEAHRSNTSVILENIPMGDYSGIGFSVGLDSAENHSDPASWDIDHPLSPVNNAMHWNWTAGYIFVASEGRMADDNESFVFHLAGDQNRVDYHFNSSYTKEKPALEAKFRFDYEEMFQNPYTFDIEIDGNSTHSETDPVTVALISNLPTCFTLQEVK